ncbi:MAG: tetratricopeptide repeat protein [Candidatus Binatia bacterium]|jgi:cytochrome c-type biogenesis protein CcmH/NrfG
MIYIVAFLIAIVAVIAVTYPLWGPKGQSLETEGDEETGDLRLRREKLYETIREIELEREAGSLSQEEYEKTRAAYEMQAARLLQEEERHGKPRPEPSRKPAPTKAGATAPQPVSHRLGLIVPAALILLVGVGIGFFLGRSLTSREEGMGITGSVPRGERVLGTPTSLEEANAAFNQGDFGRALAGYRRILDSDPQNLEALTQIGVLLARGEHHDEAIKTFDMVLDIQPNYPHALFEKGLVYFQGKVQPREGVKVWEQLIKTAPPGNEYAVTAKRMLAQVRGSMPRPSTESPARSSGN